MAKPTSSTSVGEEIITNQSRNTKEHNTKSLYLNNVQSQCSQLVPKFSSVKWKLCNICSPGKQTYLLIRCTLPTQYQSNKTDKYNVYHCQGQDNYNFHWTWHNSDIKFKDIYAWSHAKQNNGHWIKVKTTKY